MKTVNIFKDDKSYCIDRDSISVVHLNNDGESVKLNIVADGIIICVMEAPMEAEKEVQSLKDDLEKFIFTDSYKDSFAFAIFPAVEKTVMERGVVQCLIDVDLINAEVKEFGFGIKADTYAKTFYVNIEFDEEEPDTQRICEEAVELIKEKGCISDGDRISDTEIVNVDHPKFDISYVKWDAWYKM